MQTPSFAQLFAFGLAASTAVSGLQISENTGIVRRVAGHALVALAAPVLAAPINTVPNLVGQVVKLRRDDGGCDDDADDAADDADDAADDADDAADDANDDVDDAADDADDAADDADDAADDESDD